MPLKASTILRKSFDIKSGEGHLTRLLFTYSFFLGLSVSFYFTAATSLFLARYNVSVLPYTFILSGVIGYGLGCIFSALQRIMLFGRFVMISLLVSLGTVTVLTVAFDIFPGNAAVFLLFIWVKVFMVVNNMGFWGVASRVLDLQQGKRLYGLVSTGEVLSYIIGFTSIPFILRYIPTGKVLYISIFSLAIAFVVLLRVRQTLGNLLDKSWRAKESKKAVIDDDKKVEKKYSFMVSIVAFMPIVALCFADYLFLGQVRKEFGSQEVIAKFIALFYSGMSVIELFMKSSVSGRLVKRFGLRAGLVLLSAVMIFATFMASIAGAAFGTTGLFFAFLALERFSMRVIRNSFHEPAFQVLFMSVPSSLRGQFQARIEAIPRNLGYIAAGAVLILLSFIPSVNIFHFNILFLIFSVVWFRLTIKTCDYYQETLHRSLQHTETDENELNDSNELLLSPSRLSSMNCKQARSALAFIEVINPDGVSNLLTGLLQNRGDTLQWALIQIEERVITDAITPIAYLMADYEGKELENLRRLHDWLTEAPLTSVDEIAKLSNSQDSLQRIKAARLIAVSRRNAAFSYLQKLLDDTQLEVRKAALLAAGKANHQEFWPTLLSHLEIAEYRSEADAAIRKIGVPVLGELAKLSQKINVSRNTRLAAIDLMEDIGGDRLIMFLHKHIANSDLKVRNRVQQALSRCGFHAGAREAPTIRNEIMFKVSATVWLTAAITDLLNLENTEELVQSLRAEFVQKKEEVFLLLAMLYESSIVERIRQHIMNGSGESQRYAIEILESILSNELKELLLPLFDQLSDQEFINKYRYKFPQGRMSHSDRLIDIIDKDTQTVNHWTRATAILRLGKMAIVKGQITSTLLANCVHPDDFIAETAAWVLCRSDSESYQNFKTRLIRCRQTNSLSTLTFVDSGNDVKYPSIVQTVYEIQRVDIFSTIPALMILEMARSVTREHLITGQIVPDYLLGSNSIIIVASGSIGRFINGVSKESLSVGKFIPAIAPLNDGALYQAQETTELVILKLQLLFRAITNQSRYTQPILSALLNIV